MTYDSIHITTDCLIHVSFCHFADTASINAWTTCNAVDESQAEQCLHRQNLYTLIFAGPLATCSNRFSIGVRSKTWTLQLRWPDSWLQGKS